MRVLRAIGKFIWRFMVIFSFIVNLVLVIVVAALLLLIFDIKQNVAVPLVAGLHSSFVGLDQATIDWTIPVRDTVPVRLSIPLQQNTIVTLTEPVPLTVLAQINAPGLTVSNATVSLSLPAGLQLPVALDLTVPVDSSIPVNLDVRAVIPLENTQLHDVAENLRLLFEPLAIGLYNLPDNFEEAGALVGDVLAGNPPNLLAPNEYSANPWPGYSLTAGLNYPPNLLTAPVPEGNIARPTGIVPLGGIPALDEQLRPEVYAAGGPQTVNEQARAQLGAQNVNPVFFNGQFGMYRLNTEPPPTTDNNGETPGTTPPLQPVTPEDQGIIPTPTGN